MATLVVPIPVAAATAAAASDQQGGRSLVVGSAFPRGGGALGIQRHQQALIQR
jgi:hypothetical protein